MRRIAKFLKTAAGVALAAFALRAGARFLLLDTSYQAVLVAAAPVIRAPIAGHLAGDIGPQGRLYDLDEMIVEIEARAAREDHLENTRLQLARARAEKEALVSEHPELQALQGGLRATSASYNAHRADRLRATLAQAEAELAAAKARQAQSATNLARVEALFTQGLESEATVEQARRDSEVASQSVSASLAAKEAAQGVFGAARSGLQIDSFSSDKTYSAQRLDELTLRMIDWRARHAVVDAEVGSLEGQLANAEREAAIRGKAVVTAPFRGRLWQVNATVRDFVAASAPLLKLANCRTPFVAVSTSEATYNKVRIGQRATFRLGSTRERLDAVVVQTFGVMSTPVVQPLNESSLVPTPDTAFQVSTTRGVQGLVLLQLDRWPAGLDCQVGATGDVLFESDPRLGWLW